MGRIIDFTVALIGIVALSPLLLAVAVAVRMNDGGPVLYQARRVGKDGRPFLLCKFRTMVLGAERMGGGITVNGDRRVTRVGRFLRKYKIDELPQLFNVLKGDMSLVGPRPEDPRYVEHYTAEQRKLLTVLPGITSPASLHFRNEESLLSGAEWEKLYLERILPRKLEMELEYFPKRSLGSDVGVIIRTLGGILQ